MVLSSVSTRHRSRIAENEQPVRRARERASVRRRKFVGQAFLPADLDSTRSGRKVGKQECLPYNNWGDVEVVTRRRRAQIYGQPITNNSRESASMSGEEENKRSGDNAKDPEAGVDAAMQRRGVRIGFGRHGAIGYLLSVICYLGSSCSRTH